VSTLVSCPNSFNSLTSSQLLTIINELFSAGAEAISLNGHRITAMSAVYEFIC